MGELLFSLLVFPGVLFLSVLALVFEFIDRRLYARFQNRQGPPWFQPLADLIKLASKEEIIPEQARPSIFRAMPLVAFAAVVTSWFYIPLWGPRAAGGLHRDDDPPLCGAQAADAAGLPRRGGTQGRPRCRGRRVAA